LGARLPAILDAGSWMLDEKMNIFFVYPVCLSSIKHLASSPAVAGFRFKQ
jgi:hypothetical protein